MIPVTQIKLDSNICKIVGLGDLHYGHPGQDRKLVRRSLAKVKEFKEQGIPAYAFSIGDNLDNPSKFAEGGEISIQDAAEYLAEDFRDYAADGSLLGFIQGNHDVRVTKSMRSKVDLVEKTVNEWNEIYKRSIFYDIAHILMVCLKDGDRGTRIAILLHHGFGGGRTIGTVMNNLEKLQALCVNADAIVAGHRHIEGTMEINRGFLNKQAGSHLIQTTNLIALGANLSDADYALRFGLPPSLPSNSIITLTARPKTNHRKDFGITIESIK